MTISESNSSVQEEDSDSFILSIPDAVFSYGRVRTTITWSTTHSLGCEGTDCLLRRNVGTKMKWLVEEMTSHSTWSTWQRKPLPLVQICKMNHISNSELKSFNWNLYIFQEIKINLFIVKTNNWKYHLNCHFKQMKDNKYLYTHTHSQINQE